MVDLLMLIFAYGCATYRLQYVSRLTMEDGGYRCRFVCLCACFV